MRSVLCVCGTRVSGLTTAFALRSSPRRLKYIEAELAKRRGAAGGGEAEAVPVEGWAAAEAALYETPAELRQDSPGRGAADQEGADRWLTGITEVQLPVEYKLKVRCLLLLSQTREPIELALAALINR